jgi:hypothetical protein
VSQASKAPLAGAAGAAATLVFYFVLMVVQIDNADMACESNPRTVLGADFEAVRGIGFENSFMNLGGRCTYRMDDGSVVVTREPGWWFSGTIAGFVAMLAGLAVLVGRRKGHSGILYGLTTLVAPPLGLTLVATAPRKIRIGFPPNRAGGS